ncbi:MAG TPA: 50S ribosome-binding GTPase, partial [Anaerolineae bacterium]|nr:50S ribosome-binding GTPase [Anaerolineae bacterium]
RRVDLPGGTAILITDTVGFIQKLPTTLIAAFRATLEEVQEADLLLHVIDASHPQAREQARAVYDTLQEIGASDIPLLTALNKVDRFEDPQAAGLALYDLPNTVAISALTGYGLETLKLRLEEALEAEMARVKVQLPFDRGDLVSLFHERGLIQTEEYQEQGTYIVGRIPHTLLPQFEAYQVKARRR